MSDVLADRFTIDHDGASYEFKIPSIRFDIETGYRAADVRRRAFPEGHGELGSVDFNTVQFSRACAYLELYLVGSSTLWPYGIADDSDLSKSNMAQPPKVDFEKFPISASNTVLEVGFAFEQRYAQFRRPRHSANRPTGPEAVVGEQNSGS
jgi:hypothetical protein